MGSGESTTFSAKYTASTLGSSRQGTQEIVDDDSDEELDLEDIQPETSLKGNYPRYAAHEVYPIFVEGGEVVALPRPKESTQKKETIDDLLNIDSADIDNAL